MADVQFDPTNTNPKELYGQGLRAYILQDYDIAVRALSRASELLTAELKDEAHDSLGDIYLCYGKSLLELARKESEPLAEGAVKNTGEEEGEDEGEEGEDEGGEEDEQEEGGEESKEEEEDKQNSGEPGETKKDETETESARCDGEGTSKDEPKAEGEAEELTDLQVAWEVLELAKRIFANRGDDGRKPLAETLIALGEISLESGNYEAAIEDILQGLEIQRSLFGNDSRTIAQTHFKLGTAYSIDDKIDEAIEQFYSAFEYLKTRLEKLKGDTAKAEENRDEIEEIEALIPEVQEKIADMKNYKVEMEKKLAADKAEAKTNGSAECAPSSSKQANDISHLVKRKRKPDEEVADENPAKKQPSTST